MKKLRPYPEVDFGEIKKAQNEARIKHKNTQKKLNIFENRTKKLKHFYSRHRTNWTTSWDELNLRQSILSKSLDEQAESLFVFEISSKNLKFYTPPNTSLQINAEITEMNAAISTLTAEIEALQNNDESFSMINNQKLQIPGILWDKFHEAGKICPESALNLMTLANDIISDVSFEHEKMAEISRNLQNQDKQSQDWITFISQIWPRHDEKSVTYSNDLKLILQREKLVSPAKLNAVERILIQAQAQQERVHLAESEAVKNIGNILRTIDQLIVDFEYRLKLIQEKQNAKIEWDSHCHKIKENLQNMKEVNETTRKIKFEEEKRQKEIELLKAIEMDEKLQQHRKNVREQINQWKEQKLEISRQENVRLEIEKFEQRMKFNEQLPILKQAAERRENMRQQKIENNQKLKEAQILEMKKKEEILEQIRQQVRVEAESDPARVVSNTKSWRVHLMADRNRKELFSLHSFNDKQLMNDQRLRFQVLLREGTDLKIFRNSISLY